MGREQGTNGTSRAASDRRTTGRRLGWRTCLRKGCGRRYQARQWNQQYCQDPECLRLVRRWHATRRQRARRAAPEGREKHAQVERIRRQRTVGPRKPAVDGDSTPTVTAVSAGAWSRSETPLPHVLCDRPGCYEPPRDSRRVAASYCSDACRGAMRQVRDRKRKYLARKTKAGRLKRRLEYAAAAKKRLPLVPANQDASRSRQIVGGVAAGRIAVGDYGPGKPLALPFRQSSEVAEHDSQTSSGSRPRAPPAGGRLVVD
jgi:hypothetical protein